MMHFFTKQFVVNVMKQSINYNLLKTNFFEKSNIVVSKFFQVGMRYN